MSDVSGAAATEQQPDLSPEAFGAAEEGEIRSTPEKPIQAPEPAGDDESLAAGEGEPDEEVDPYAEPPEFWSAERKALWERVTDPEARKAIHEQEKDRTTATNKKIEEAAFERKSASEKATALETERNQLVAWWQDTGPKLAEAFKSKWDAVNWTDLAENNQAEYVRLTHLRDKDFALFQQTAEKHGAEVQKANKRAAEALGESKKAEHGKLAERYPEHFGKPDVAQKTYDDLRDFMIERGVPADRIPNIYESFVVGIALDAMLYNKAQKAAKDAKANPQPSTTATLTPRRIVPGAATRGGQPNQSAAYRQARERLSNGENLSREEAGLLFS